ncbi:MAG: type I-C CRISPR-associated protein Cas5 [Butyrivibrio sp.]|nr:type I-C CRISPR-associated protein Cas5 [Butyrivibrio sp.]
MFRNKVSVSVDVWGDFACFTQSDAKVERVSYLIPTPSACRGILEAIYAKPIEFKYQITGIDVFNPIRTTSVKKNEVTRKISLGRRDKPVEIVVDDNRTQRNTIYLKDVYYRIYADLMIRSEADKRVTVAKIEKEFRNRVVKGKCFYQPYLGNRECICYFSPVDESKEPLHESRDMGIMLYDIFDPWSTEPLDTEKGTGSIQVTYYHPFMINGHINVPKYNSPEVFGRKEG